MSKHRLPREHARVGELAATGRMGQQVSGTQSVVPSRLARDEHHLDVRLRAALFESLHDVGDRRVRFWLAASLLFGVGLAVPALFEAFSAPYVVQDDARLHVFWMARFLDPGAFPNDRIADYFQSAAPFGYVAVYRFATLLGLDPFAFNKLLPPLLAALTTFFGFRLSLALFPLPSAAFLSTALLNESLWLKDDIASATTRAFLYPILLALLYFLARRSLRLGLVCLVALGLFYPPFLPIGAGLFVLRLTDWTSWPPRLTVSRGDLLACAAAIAIAVLVLLPYLLTTSEFDPVVSGAEARRMPEFHADGRSAFFIPNPLVFWLFGGRSGLFPAEWWELPIPPPHAILALLLPLVLLRRFTYPLAGRISGHIRLLPELLMLGFGMFVLSHLLLFRAFLPGRFTQVNLRLIVALAAGIAIVIVLEALSRRGARARIAMPTVLVGVCLVALLLLLYPLALLSLGGSFPSSAYLVGNNGRLYEFFARQPPDTLVASVSLEVDYIPSFSRRSILSGREYGIPLHLGYYNEYSARTVALMQAHYTSDLEELQAFVQRYGVDFFLLEEEAFTRRYVERNDWLVQFDHATELEARIERGPHPALERLAERCKAFESGRFVVLDAACILQPPR